MFGYMAAKRWISVDIYGRAKLPKRGVNKKKKNRTLRKRKTVGVPQQLRAWRTRNKLSQTNAADKLRMSKRTLQEWEQGRATPRGLALAALQDKLGTLVRSK